MVGVCLTFCTRLPPLAAVAADNRVVSMTVRRMVNPVMAYAWGSRDGIATLQGRPASDEPEAELWMGAHPQAPSRLEAADGSADQGLDEVIAADPVAALGAASVERFGPRLPFLLKVLSAEHPLSLQVHPDDDLARQGFADENAAGIDLAAPNRCYRDPYAKPEMLVAITDFHVLQGFRPADEAAAAVEGLDIDRLRGLIGALRAGTPTGEVFLRLIEWPDDDRGALVAEVCAAAVAHPEDAGVMPWLPLLGARYPADPGVVGVLLLNYLTLEPGQGLYVRPGQIHAYMHGTGVEILGGSDNVIRGGLTPKHVSVADLRAVLAVEAREPSLIDPVCTADGDEAWPTPQAEFELRRWHIDDAVRSLATRGPTVLLCLEGTLGVSDRDSSITLGPGQSAFVAAVVAGIDVDGNGVLMCANPGLV
jgi:mannose-6-phosphate isomerase